MVYPFVENFQNDQERAIPFSLIGIIPFLGSLCVFVLLFKSQIEIDVEKIRYIGVFKTREMNLTEIGGYRMREGRFIVFLSRDNHEKIKIPLLFEPEEEFVAWVENNYKNLDENDWSEESKEALSSEKLGIDVAGRKQNLSRARRFVWKLGFAAVGLCVWSFAFPRPHELVMWFLVLFPLISVGVLPFFNGAVRLNTRGNSPYIMLAPVLLFPTLALDLKAFGEWNVLSWIPFWIPFFSIFLVSMALLFFLLEDIRKKSASLALAIFICGFYGYGTTVVLNGILDKSPPEVIETQILKKRVFSGKYGLSYYLTLAPWGSMKREEEVLVDGETYERHFVTAGPAKVILKRGYFNIPWILVY